MTSRDEIEKHFLAFEKLHEACFRGEADWGELGGYFTEDVDYRDPGWGRFRDRKSVEQFLRASMSGMEATHYPMQWYIIEGERVVKKYRMIITDALRPDGSPYEISGVYLMHYAGDGKFDQVEDQLNMRHFHQMAKTTGWTPGKGYRAPASVCWD